MLNDGIGKEYDALCNLQEVAIDDYVISGGSPISGNSSVVYFNLLIKECNN